jgi:hypothetical protein
LSKPGGLESIRVVTAAFWCVGCGLITDPYDPRSVPPIDAAVKFSPPARYQTLWNKLMACTQLSNNFASIAWSRSDVIVVRGQQYVGFSICYVSRPLGRRRCHVRSFGG